MNTKNFCIGAGDRSVFLKMVLETDPHEIPDLYKKLQLVCQIDFNGLSVANDKSC